MIDIHNMTVLIVDDMPNMVTTIRSMMKVLKYGGKFLMARDGSEAWATLKKQKEEPVECAIIDYNMPYVSGSELLSRIREDTELRELPVVMVTAEANMDFVADAAESEIDAYILKPPTVKVLDEKIRGVIERANNPSPMDFHLRKARDFAEAGDFDAAIQEAKEAAQANPASSKPLHELGSYYLKKRDLEKAEKWLLKAADMNPLDVSAFHQLGKLYVMVNNLGKAFEFLEKAMKINPRDVSRAVYFGTTLLGKGMIEDAIKVFNKALALGEDSLKLKEQIAEFCIEKKAKEYGAKLLESIIRSDPSRTDLFFKLGRAMEELGQYSRALVYLTGAEKEDSDNLDIKRHLAKAYLAQGKSIRAEKYLKQILAADTENEEALNLLKQCV